MTRRNPTRCIKCRQPFDGHKCVACYPPPRISTEPTPEWKRMLEMLAGKPKPEGTA